MSRNDFFMSSQKTIKLFQPRFLHLLLAPADSLPWSWPTLTSNIQARFFFVGTTAICRERLGVCRFSIQLKTAAGDSFFLYSWWSANLWNNLLQSLARKKTCTLLSAVAPVLPPFCPRSDESAHTGTAAPLIHVLGIKWQLCPEVIGNLRAFSKAGGQILFWSLLHGIWT